MTTSTQDAPESACRLNDLIGQESVSEWRVIEQETVDRYAAVSGDGEGEWIHLNPERAAREAPYGGTIVPGFLQVANLTRLFGETVKGFKGVDPNHALNYGFDRLELLIDWGWLHFITRPMFELINFLYGIPQWAVSIAVEQDGEALVGVVHDPAKRETWTAVRGAV